MLPVNICLKAENLVRDAVFGAVGPKPLSDSSLLDARAKPSQLWTRIQYCMSGASSNVKGENRSAQLLFSRVDVIRAKSMCDNRQLQFPLESIAAINHRQLDQFASALAWQSALLN